MAFVLIGFMGAGKSTAAAELAGALGATSFDSDALLEEQLGHTIAEEFGLNGEESFRARERELVSELLQSAPAEAVIALGGGSLASEEVRTALAGHTTILLDIDPETAWTRVSGAAGERPLARDRDAFLALHAARRDTYESLADAVLSDLPFGAVAAGARALRGLAAAPTGTGLLWAHSRSGEYPVFVGRGLLAEPESLGSIWPLDRERSRPFCVSDSNVHRLYGAQLGELAGNVVIEPGESQKTLASAELVWQALVGAGATRADHLLALGGGVVGDLAGFCAATYQRGIPVVQVPTTLVAQVDSAYGGKTGVDLPEAKNYVGAYHQPAGVIADVDTLASLPAAEVAAGWVEVLKTALVAGGELWQTVAAGADVDERIVLACARTKLAVVAADERDGGHRQVLNLGHTIGHAIETATGYGRYRHGEAVGIGLLGALALSGRAELRSQVRELLLARGLPVSFEGASVDDVIEASSRDKKRLGERVPFVLVNAPGDVDYGREVAAAELRAAVTELAA